MTVVVKQHFEFIVLKTHKLFHGNSWCLSAADIKELKLKHCCFHCFKQEGDEF